MTVDVPPVPTVLRLRVDAVALDRDRVRDAREGWSMTHRDLAGLGGQRRLVELQRALVGRQLERLAAHRRSELLLGVVAVGVLVLADFSLSLLPPQPARRAR